MAILMSFSVIIAANLVDGANDEIADALADLFRGAVEDVGDVKAALGKALVARHRAAQIARADQRDLPVALDFQHLPQLIFQEGDLVARSLLAEAAEMRQVFADLRRTDAQPLAEFVRRRDFLPFLGQPFKRAEINRQTADHNIWDSRRHSARLSWQPIQFVKDDTSNITIMLCFTPA